MGHEKKMVGAFAAALLCVSLLAIFFYFHSSFYYSSSHFQDSSQRNLLSLRVYTGLLEPKSHLIMHFEPLKGGIQEYLAANNIHASVYVVNLRDGASMGINDLQGYVPASLSKVPLAMVIMQKVGKGEISLDEEIPLRNDLLGFASGNLYASNLSSLPLRDLIELLLVESDNTAYASLQPYVTDSELASLLHYVDYYSEDKVFDAEKDSERRLITTHSMYRLFSSLYFSTVLDPEHSEYLLDLMSQSTFDVHTMADLPDDIILSQKFGAHYPQGEEWMHDCGIMYEGEMRLFYCVMTRDLGKIEAEKTIGAIVNSIYRYSTQTRTALDKLE